MSIHIVTPSLDQLGYLRRCVASVRDQQVDTPVEQRVIDGGSIDGTANWLREQGVAHVSEPDRGMYDALNKGLKHALRDNATDALFAWLNADEQYLPGALQRVVSFFAAHPDVDMLCGDALIVDPAGQLVTYWKSLPLRRVYLQTGALYNFSCAMFFRARVFGSGIRFNASYKAIADHVLVRDLARAGARSACLRAYLAAYTYAPSNISNQPAANAERLAAFRAEPLWLRATAPVARLVRAGERTLRGTRRQSFPLEYALYSDNAEQRTTFSAQFVSARWPDPSHPRTPRTLNPEP